MSAVADTLPPSPGEPAASRPTTSHATRPFFWSVRRELWENRSLFIAPLAAAALVLVGFAISLSVLVHSFGVQTLLQPHDHLDQMSGPYTIGAMLVLVAAYVTGLFYCLGALHNERRDRSILFWKSMPVSDLLTVASKAVVPMAVLPAISFAVIIVLHVLMVVVETLVLGANGVSPAVFLGPLNLPAQELVLAYAIVTSAIWYAPVFGWLLLVSGWARRVTFLWAILPPAGLCIFEQLAFNTHHLATLVGHRLGGAHDAAFAQPVGDLVLSPHSHEAMTLATMDPVGFVTRIDVWAGLAVGVALTAAAVWMRRYRDPI
jgi:ABC-2 type transport system permease protein